MLEQPNWVNNNACEGETPRVFLPVHLCIERKARERIAKQKARATATKRVRIRDTCFELNVRSIPRDLPLRPRPLQPPTPFAAPHHSIMATFLTLCGCWHVNGHKGNSLKRHGNWNNTHVACGIITCKHSRIATDNFSRLPTTRTAPAPC